MAITTAPLGFQKPDGNEPFRQGNDVISANAQKAQDLIAADKARLALLEQSAGFPGDPVEIADDVVQMLVTDPTSAIAAALDETFAPLVGSHAYAAKSVETSKLDKTEASTTYLKVTEAPLTPERFGALGNGTANDTSAINDMLAAVVPGGTIRLLPNRRYITDGGHILDTPSVTIEDPSGRAQTYNTSAQMYLRNGANSDMLTISATQVTIRDLSLYGNYNNQTSTSRGIVTPVTSTPNYLLLDSVWVDSFNGDGYSSESSGGTISSTMVNCESRKNRGYGMRFTSTATDSMVSNSYIDQNTQSGVFCSEGDLSLTSVHIWGNETAASGDRDGITLQVPLCITPRSPEP